MAILIDPVITHGSGNLGNDTVPPGISGLDWCHIVSDTSVLELTMFLTANILTVGCPATNVRTPLLGSLITYAGLSATQYAATVTAGATENNKRYVVSHAFDSNGGSIYEPGW